MRPIEASVVTSASAEAAWAAWTDVAGWSAFDHIEQAQIDGEFRPGAVITSRAKGSRSSTATVTCADRPSRWVDEVRSPGMRITFDHLIESGGDGTRLTERASISGPIGRLLGPFLRRKLEALFAESAASVVLKAEAAESAD